MNIGFIGLGKLGLPCAEEIAKKGHTVNGFDQADVKSQHIRILDSIEQTVTIPCSSNWIFVTMKCFSLFSGLMAVHLLLSSFCGLI